MGLFGRKKERDIHDFTQELRERNRPPIDVALEEVEPIIEAVYQATNHNEQIKSEHMRVSITSSYLTFLQREVFKRMGKEGKQYWLDMLLERKVTDDGKLWFKELTATLEFARGHLGEPEMQRMSDAATKRAVETVIDGVKIANKQT